MYFDSRDVAANTRRWYKSINRNNMTARVEVDPEGEIREWHDISDAAYKMIDEEGCVDLPIEFEVCTLCRGKGKHVNPSIDAHGISAEEWDRDWSYEDQEMYMSGGYDVVCYECGGENVVPELIRDEARVSKEVLEFIKIIDDDARDEAAYVHECMMERMMGA